MKPFRVDRVRGVVVGGGAVLLAALGLAACASSGLKLGSDGRYRSKDLGYAIDAPRFAEPDEWRKVKVDDTDLAWRTDDGRSMSLASSCRRTRAKPALLARQLLIGVPRDDIVSAHPVALRGDPGWAQVVDTGGEDHSIRIQTVTVVGGGCVYDWVLVGHAGPRFEASVDTFDRWWSSFERARGADEPPASHDADGAGDTVDELVTSPVQDEGDTD